MTAKDLLERLLPQTKKRPAPLPPPRVQAPLAPTSQSDLPQPVVKRAHQSSQSSPPTSSSTAADQNGLPPIATRIPPCLSSHTSLQIRTKTLELLYREYHRIYKQLVGSTVSDTDAVRAIVTLMPSIYGSKSIVLNHEHVRIITSNLALVQEKKAHDNSNKNSYRNASMLIFKSLCTRKGITIEEMMNEVKTLLASASTNSQRQSSSQPQNPHLGQQQSLYLTSSITRAEPAKVLKGSDLSKYIISRELLEAFGYIVDIPSSSSSSSSLSSTNSDNANKLNDSIKHNQVDKCIPSVYAGTRHKCSRCKLEFAIPNKMADWAQHVCWFHPGRRAFKGKGRARESYYTCCRQAGGGDGSGLSGDGCETGPHVFKDEDAVTLHAVHPFINVSDALSNRSCGGSHKVHEVLALDCEMCYTSAGFELARLTAIDASGKTVVDELVKPRGVVLDLNTRYSGLTSLDDAKHDQESAIRDCLLPLMNKETILLGHGLDNDMTVMRLIHDKIVDTSVVFPHHRGPPWRLSLRSLVEEHLGRYIQEESRAAGHDSVEDSQACLDLMAFAVSKKMAMPKFNGPRMELSK